MNRDLHCCWIDENGRPCLKPAAWLIQSGRLIDDYVHACELHVGPLLNDHVANEHRVTRLTRSSPSMLRAGLTWLQELRGLVDGWRARIRAAKRRAALRPGDGASA